MLIYWIAISFRSAYLVIVLIISGIINLALAIPNS